MRIAFALLLLCLAPAPVWADYGSQDIAQRVTSYLKQQSGHLPGRVRIHVSPPDARLRMPQCAELSFARLSAGALYGAQTVRVQCLAPRRWTVYVPAKIEVFVPVLVSAKPLAAGQTLGPGDAIVLERDLANLPSGVLNQNDAVQGRELASGIAAGMVLRQDMFRARTVIQQGQSVALTVEAPGLRLVAEGIALQNGRSGQMIAVRNSKSGVQLKGIVQDNGEVKIPF